MAIYKSTPPETVRAAATNRLTSLERAQGRLNDAEVGGGIDADLSNCLPVYHVDAASLSDPMQSLSDAPHVGWKYLVESGGVMKSVDVHGDKALAVDTGRTAKDISRALEVAEQKLPEQEYDARMLTFGRAESPVLWFHPNDGVDERFFKLGPEPEEVEPVDVLYRAAKAYAVRSAGFVSTSEPSDDESGG